MVIPCIHFDFRKKYNVSKLKSDIKEALKFGNVKFTRRKLAIVLNTIEKTSSKNTGRRRRSAYWIEKSLMFLNRIMDRMRDKMNKAVKATTNEISSRLIPPSNYILSWFGYPIGKTLIPSSAQRSPLSLSHHHHHLHYYVHHQYLSSTIAAIIVIDTPSDLVVRTFYVRTKQARAQKGEKTVFLNKIETVANVGSG